MSGARVNEARGHADWPVITAALLAGVASAVQIGKASAALPLLRAEFGVGVAQASWYLSLFSLGAALFGSVLGILTLKTGPMWAGGAGLVLVALGSLAGPFAETWDLLLAARLVEALGLPLVVAAMPAIIQARSSGPCRVLAMGLWSTWLPLGVALAMALSSVVLAAGGWRALFWLCGALPLLALSALAVLVARRRNPAAVPVPAPVIRMPDAATLMHGGLFGLFSASYLTVQGFLPSVAVEALSMSIAEGTQLAGLAALLVIPGNLIASTLLSRGVSARLLLAAGFLAMGLSGAAFLADLLPPVARIVAGCVFTACAGVPPGVIWGLIPQIAARSGAGPAMTSGVIYQCAGVGQLLGPVLAGAAVQATGTWSGGALVILAASGLALWGLSLRAGRLEDRGITASRG